MTDVDVGDPSPADLDTRDAPGRASGISVEGAPGISVAGAPSIRIATKVRGVTRLGADRMALAGLLIGTGVLYLWSLSSSGWANQFYAAAGQAGAKSWTAFLFGSLDSSNFITVDKPPASLWVIDLSMRLFGVNSWSLLVPQALEGVAAVALLYAAVRRVAGPRAGLLAGAILATTPVATLIFRYDNPDALLVLLMTAAAYATVRAIERSGARWLVLAGALIGSAFLTKMLQGLLVVPGFAAAYLVAAPTTLGRRVWHLVAGGAAMVVAAGWWVALVQLWPAGSRPYIGGSNGNSVLELTFGYNGFGRLTGSDNNGSIGGGTGGFSSGSTGLGRLFSSDMGTQISWLLPAAFVALGGLMWFTSGRPRTDRLRASALLWGGWLVVTALVLSFAGGIIHPYYTVALAPAIAALVALGVVGLWRVLGLVAAIVAVGVLWTWQLLSRADWHPELRWLVLIAGGVAIAAILLGNRVLAVSTLAVALLAGPTAYAVQTAATAHTGAIPSAGPAVVGARFGGRPASFGGGAPAGGFGPRGGFAGAPGGFTGGAGGLGGAATISADLTTALDANARSYSWVAATTGDNEAASLELATGHAVMSLGGYNGTDPAISLAEFQAPVADGRVHYYVPDQRGFIGSTSAQSSTAYAIQQWVTSTYTAQTIGGSTVYDLSHQASG